MVGCPVSGGVAAGQRDWWIQRISALLLLLYVVGLAFYWLWHPAASLAQWRSFLLLPWMRAAGTCAWIALIWHAWLGIWTIITDYVPACMRCIALFCVGLFLLADLAAAVWLMWGV